MASEPNVQPPIPKEMTRFNIRRRIAAQLGYVPAAAGTIAHVNRLELAGSILQQPRRLQRYEAIALLQAYKAAKADADATRAALQVAAAACGRARKADAPIDRVFSRASCERLMFWAQGKNTPV